jgi:putative flippase GtrA
MIKRELAIFLLVGALTVTVDFISYRGLHDFALMSINMAKAASFLLGTLFAYFANRFWTFGSIQHIPGSAWRFALLYASTLGANVITNSLALNIFAHIACSVQLAFMLATTVSACLNFIGMKLFVFKPIIAVKLQ